MQHTLMQFSPRRLENENGVTVGRSTKDDSKSTCRNNGNVRFRRLQRFRRGHVNWRVALFEHVIVLKQVIFCHELMLLFFENAKSFVDIINEYSHRTATIPAVHQWIDVMHV